MIKIFVSSLWFCEYLGALAWCQLSSFDAVALEDLLLSRSDASGAEWRSEEDPFLFYLIRARDQQVVAPFSLPSREKWKMALCVCVSGLRQSSLFSQQDHLVQLSGPWLNIARSPANGTPRREWACVALVKVGRLLLVLQLKRLYLIVNMI